MEVTIEEFVPYDRSLIWRLHDAYFARCGAAAWTGGEIPHFATNSYASARQCARLLIGLSRDLDARGGDPAAEVRVLEIGSGLGEFADMLFEALERGLGEAGRALARRVRFILSDYSERSVREAIARRRVAALVAEGRVIPALLDMNAPEELRGLDGAPLEGPLTVVLANYVCCCARLKVFARTPADGVVERHVCASVEAPKGSPTDPQALRAQLLEGDPTRADLMKSLRTTTRWLPVDLDARLGAPVHAAAVRRSLASHEEATVQYPEPFLECLRRLAPRMREGGMALVIDFGRASRRQLRGVQDNAPVHYGNSVCFPVNFIVLDDFCREAGVAFERTRDGLLSLQCFAIRFGAEIGDGLREDFRRAYVRSTGGQDLLDFRAAAARFGREGQPADAARLLERARRLDPRSPELLFRLACACLDAGLPERALRHVDRGRRHDVDRRYAFDFAGGRALARLGRLEEARDSFLRSLALDDDAAAHAHLGMTLERLGDYRGAYRSYQRSLQLAPESDLAGMLRRKIVEQYLPSEMAVGTISAEE